MMLLPLFLFAAAFGAEPAFAGRFCAEPDYIIRAPASLPNPDLEGLLTKQENADPAQTEKLLTDTGPYGHSPLGFRYLARAFGYPGDFGKAPSEKDRQAVELWLAEREYGSFQYKGTSALWDRWAKESEFLLRAKPGTREKKLGAFFEEPVESMQYAGCLATELAQSRCENYSTRKILPGARVYYGKTGNNGRAPCAIRLNGGTIKGEPPAEVTASYTVEKKSCPEGGGECISQSDKRTWKWENPEKSGGGAAAATGPSAK